MWPLIILEGLLSVVGEIFHILFSTKTSLSLQLFISGYRHCILKSTNPESTSFFELLFYPCSLSLYISEPLLLLLSSLSGYMWLCWLRYFLGTQQGFILCGLEWKMVPCASISPYPYSDLYIWVEDTYMAISKPLKQK